MRIIVFSPQTDEGNSQLNRLIDNAAIINSFEIYRTVDKLSNCLCNPHKGSMIVVLFVINNKVFHELISIKDCLAPFRVILVLQNRKTETLAKAHSLRPRFISYSDTDTSIISDVISKMTTIKEPQKTADALPEKMPHSRY